MSRVHCLFVTAGIALLAAPGPREARARARLRQVGYSVTFGGNTFRIWGGAKTGLMPKGVSVAPDGKRLYVTNFGRIGHHNLDVYDARTLRRIKKISFVGNAIESLSSWDSKTLYVTNFYGNRLHFISTNGYWIKTTITPGRMPKQMALSPDGKHLYVANWLGRVAKVDAKTGYRRGRVRTGKCPRGLSVSPDGKTLYVANTCGRTVTVVDTATMKVRRQIRTGALPRHTAVTKDGKTLYVSILSRGTVEVIDTVKGRVTHKISVGGMPRTLELSKDEKFVYVACYSSHHLAIVDTKTRKAVVLPLDIVKASGLAVHPNDKLIYVTGWCSMDVWVVERIRPGQTPGPLGKPPKRRLYYKRKAQSWGLGCK
ncbi:MAG: YncE family protein [bacterium]